MTTEILDHAARVLRGEPTRTLRARTLFRRTAAALRIDIGYTRFVEMLATWPNHFTIVMDRTPLGDGWSSDERERYATALEQAGLMRGATVILAEHPHGLEEHALGDEIAAPALDSTLADVHAAIVDLLRVEQEAGQLSSMLGDAVLELHDLRDAYAAAVRQPKATRRASQAKERGRG